MKIQIAIANVQLNKDKPAKEMLVLFNEYGTLCVTKNLFSISFAGAIPSDVKIDYIKSIKL